PKDIVWTWSAEMRYLGQGNSIKVDLGADLAGLDAAEAARRFEAEYVRLYGRPVPGGIPEAITWRLIGESTRTTRRYALARLVDTGGRVPAPKMRRIFLPSTKSFADVPAYDRYAVPGGTTLAGPLVLTEPESTLVVPYSASVSVLESGTVRVKLEARHD
ncbi:MAG: hydantoinase/oxoprolinase family protein, partial [Alphaproteobacteria bacterium]|nr:hydantoinase/oxoprolinase family protein [Alphaproteobacteria bacterium]